MTKPHHIALLSPLWTKSQHRIVTGVLRYADSHPKILVRAFAPAKDLKTAVSELEAWGAEGILADLDDVELGEVFALLKGRIPIVNVNLTREYPGVLTMIFSMEDFVKTALDHFRQLGIRSSAFFATKEGPHIKERQLDTYLRIARPTSPSRATLIVPVGDEKVLDPFASVVPVATVLADWLRSLPKPTGIICSVLGSSGYLIRCCQALKLRVPEDIAVIGTDDPDLCLASEPTITSVTLAHEMLGQEAIRALMEWIGGNPPTTSRILLHHMDLHVRESTGLRKPEICDIPAALQYIKDNACRGATVEQVIKETQRVSAVTFHRRFKEVTGKSPAEAIRDHKLDEVRRLLISTELPLAMVAHLSGFSSTKVLIRPFRAAEGVSLSDFRKNQKGRSQFDAKTALRPVAQKARGKRKPH